MDQLILQLGISGACVALTLYFYGESKKDHQQMVQVVKDNTTAMTELRDAVRSLSAREMAR